MFTKKKKHRYTVRKEKKKKKIVFIQIAYTQAFLGYTTLYRESTIVVPCRIALGTMVINNTKEREKKVGEGARAYTFVYYTTGISIATRDFFFFFSSLQVQQNVLVIVGERDSGIYHVRASERIGFMWGYRFDRRLEGTLSSGPFTSIAPFFFSYHVSSFFFNLT